MLAILKHPKAFVAWTPELAHSSGCDSQLMNEIKVPRLLQPENTEAKQKCWKYDEHHLQLSFL